MVSVHLKSSRNVIFFLLLALLKMAHSFLAHKAPVRIGLVFCSNSKDSSNSIEETKGEIIRRVFNYAVSEEKVRKAFNLVADVRSCI